VGYYLYRIKDTDDLERLNMKGITGKIAIDFDIFIIDIEKKMAVLYSQSM
jgi:hypothetical protein